MAIKSYNVQNYKPVTLAALINDHGSWTPEKAVYVIAFVQDAKYLTVSPQRGGTTGLLSLSLVGSEPLDSTPYASALYNIWGQSADLHRFAVAQGSIVVLKSCDLHPFSKPPENRADAHLAHLRARDTLVFTL